jgi:hypothetical protein
MIVASIGIVLNPILDLADGLRPVLAAIYERQEALRIKPDEAVVDICDIIQENEQARKLIVGWLSTVLAQVEWMNGPAENDYALILRQQRTALEHLFKNKFVLKQLVKHLVTSGRALFKLVDNSQEPKDGGELNAMIKALIAIFRPDDIQAAAA